MARLKLEADDEAVLFDILQRKSHPDLDEFARARKLKARALASLAELMELNGDVAVLAQARETLRDAGAEVAAALDTLGQTVRALRKDVTACLTRIRQWVPDAA